MFTIHIEINESLGQYLLLEVEAIVILTKLKNNDKFVSIQQYTAAIKIYLCCSECTYVIGN